MSEKASETSGAPGRSIDRREVLRKTALVGAAAPVITALTAVPALAQTQTCVPALGAWLPTACAPGLNPTTVGIDIVSPSIVLEGFSSNPIVDALISTIDQTIVSPTTTSLSLELATPSSGCSGDDLNLDSTLDTSGLCDLLDPLFDLVGQEIVDLVFDQTGLVLQSATLTGVLTATIGTGVATGSITAGLLDDTCSTENLTLTLDPIFTTDPAQVDASGICDTAGCPAGDCPQCTPAPPPVVVTWTSAPLEATLTLVATIDLVVVIPIPFFPISAPAGVNVTVSAGTVDVDIPDFQTCCEFACG